MATKYEEVYASLLSKIRDYEFSKKTKEEIEYLLEMYLRPAIASFYRCRTDLSQRDDENKVFLNDLSLREIEILSSLMLVEYLKTQMYTSKSMKQVMTDKEFRFYSQANHLDQLMKLYDYTKREVVSMMNSYSYERLGEKDDN